MKKILLFIVMLFPTLIYAQSVEPQVEWFKIYDGPGNGVDLTNDIIIDRYNNIYLAGRSGGSDGSQDLLVLKYSSSGDSLLNIRYSSASQQWDEAFSIAVDSNLNFYVIGNTDFSQVIFNKYSISGELLWAKSFSSEGVIVILNSKEEPIVGLNQSAAKILKYSPSGDSLWSVIVEYDTSTYSVNYIAVDQNDYIYAGIQQFYGGDRGDLPSSKIVLLKISDSGDLIWEKRFDIPLIKKIIFDKEGNPILLASETLILKLNSEGDTLWSKEYPFGDIIVSTDLAVDSENDIVFTGYGLGNTSWDYYTKKISSDGQQIWSTTFDSDEGLRDFAHSLVIDNEDNIYVTGGTSDVVSVGYCYTLKYSGDGELKWKMKFDAPNSEFEYGNKIFLDDSNNVLIGGDVAGSTNGWNFLAFKINQNKSTGVEANNSYAPAEYFLSQNYPNPFNPVTKINFSIPQSSDVKIEVYDILGRFIFELFNEYLNTGNYNIDFDASDLPSGTYFYKLSAGANILVKKAVLIK
ncbi:MAG: T9SS type A sorting domain-containing protein [Ignavibacteriaceae bacterium]